MDCVPGVPAVGVPVSDEEDRLLGGRPRETEHVLSLNIICK